MILSGISYILVVKIKEQTTLGFKQLLYETRQQKDATPNLFLSHLFINFFHIVVFWEDEYIFNQKKILFSDILSYSPLQELLNQT